MSDTSQGDGWWIASDGKWYPPEQHPDYVAPPAADTGAAAATTQMPAAQAPGADTPNVVGSPLPDYAAETVAMPAAAVPPASTPPSPAATPGPTFTSASAPTETFVPDQASDPQFDLGAAEEPSSRRGMILGAGALVLVALLGFLAFRFFTGGSGGTGAESAEAAVQQMITSINDKDAVGFVEVFDPDEIDAWFGSFGPAFSTFEGETDESDEEVNEITEAYRSLFDSFGYSISGANGGPISFDLEPLDDNGRIVRVRIEDLDIEFNAPNADGRALIGSFGGGEASGIDLSEVDGFRVELRDDRNGLESTATVPGQDTIREYAEDAHLDFITVEKDGKWYINVGYSLLEIARNQPGSFPGNARPEFGLAYELVDAQTGGAESAEGVIMAFADALEDLDYQAMIGLTDPLSMPYLHDYQPLIDEQVDDNERRDAANDLRANFGDLELGISEWEGRTLVTFGNIEGTIDGGTFEFNANTWCGFAENGDGDTVDGCLEDAISEGLYEIDSDANPADLLPEQIGMIVVERNGRWFLDPLGTMGFYMDQSAEAIKTVADDLEDGFSDGAFDALNDFVLLEGPIASQGSPATAQAESGRAGVALDLSGYNVIANGSTETHVALARVTHSAPGTYLSYDNPPLGDADWIVVYDEDRDGTNDEFPAIIASTDGDLTVELFEVQATELTSDGFSGQLGGEGRPQIFYFGNDLEGLDITIEGVDYETVSPWDSYGALIDRPSYQSGIYGDDLFVVIQGEPGAVFTITTSSFDLPEPEEEPEPVPEPDPFASSDLGDPVADDFAFWISIDDYEYTDSLIGGYFDGCGPDDPDVTSYNFTNAVGEIALVTPYPSQARAQAAHDALLLVESPCEAFQDLVVVDVTETSANNIRITWEFDDGTGLTYEHYRLVGDAVVVAVNEDLDALEEQLRFLDTWSN